MSSNKNIVLNVGEWEPTAVKYMAPKINDKGMKSINIISKQSNRSLNVITPLMMTWGVSDFTDEKGESDGKFSISLNFPNEDYKNENTDLFLNKLKAFETQILDDAVKNAELWWGETLPREVIRHSFFPFIKYSKNRDTKKIDYNKPPSIRARVPFYNEKWGIEVYDTNSNMLFPSADDRLTPVDFIPKLSSVACVLNCNGIWIGGKGWGLTWKLVQCVVKPRIVQSVYGTCHIKLSVEETAAINSQSNNNDDDDVQQPLAIQPSNVKPLAIEASTFVDDSDDDNNDDNGEETDTPHEVNTNTVVSEPELVAETPTPLPTPPVKKIVKKTVPVVATPEPVTPPVEPTVPAVVPVKKTIKKTVKA